MRRLLIFLGLPLLGLLGAGMAMGLGGTSTVTACATASVPPQTISANGSPVGTIPGASSTQCVTTTYTQQTVTVGSTTTPPTTTTTVGAPSVSGVAAVGSVVQCVSSDPAPTYRWQNNGSGAYVDVVGVHTSKGYLIQASDAGTSLRCVVNGTASAPVSVPALPPPPTTTTVPTTTTPTGNGSILYRGDFETGDISQWNWGGQCSNTGVQTDATYNRGTITVSGAYAQQGNYGAHIVLVPDGSRRQACEVLEHRPLVVDTWYGFVVNIAAGSTTNSSGTTIAQLNYQGIWGPPEGLAAFNPSTCGSTGCSEETPNSVQMSIQSGFCFSVSTPSPGCTYFSGWAGSSANYSTSPQYAIPPGSFHEGTAYEIICHIHFAVDSSGVYECWWRLRGAFLWTTGGRYAGIPTVQWTSTASLPSEDVDKLGAYRPADSSSSWVVDLDGFVAATSFDSTAAVLP